MRSFLVPALAVAIVLSAQEPDAIRVDVDLVTVACSVTDHGGAPVRNLRREDFILSDNGQPREIRYFWKEAELPLTIALVADVSGSQASFVKSHRDAIGQFLKQVIGPHDRAMIVEIAQQAWLLSDLTNSPEDLATAVEKIGTKEGKQSPLLGEPCRNSGFPRSCGGTALWHGLYYTAAKLKSVPGRKAILVLSDGMDTGSDIRLSDLIERAQSSETVVYAIKYASPARFFSLAATLEQAFSKGLERLAFETGGLTFSNPGKKIADVFSRIESDMRNLYVLGFAPGNRPDDDGFHKLEVKMVKGDYVVRARAGYWPARK